MSSVPKPTELAVGAQARQHRRGRLVADLRRRVQSAGLAGVGAMVILNSVYYTGARVLSQPYACARWFDEFSSGACML